MNPDDTIRAACELWSMQGEADVHWRNTMQYLAANERFRDRAIGRLVRGGLANQWERDLLYRLTGVRVRGPARRPVDYRGRAVRRAVRDMLREAGLADGKIDELLAERTGRDLDAVTRERYRDKN